MRHQKVHSSTVVRFVFYRSIEIFSLRSASIKLSHKINLNVNITILKKNKDTNSPKGPTHQDKHSMAFIIWCLILMTKQKLQSQRSGFWGNTKKSWQFQSQTITSVQSCVVSSPITIKVINIFCSSQPLCRFVILRYDLKTVTLYPLLLPSDTNPA